MINKMSLRCGSSNILGRLEQLIQHGRVHCDDTVHGGIDSGTLLFEQRETSWVSRTICFEGESVQLAFAPNLLCINPNVT